MNRRELFLQLAGALAGAGLVYLGHEERKRGNHMKILIESVPHSEQRYDTVGDWQWKTVDQLGLVKPSTIHSSEPVLHIKVSQMSDWRYEALVGLHEAIEALLCKQAGVTEEEVDAFDFNFSLAHFEGEPGDDQHAPYHHQHQFASSVEANVAFRLKVDWAEYSKEINSL